MLDEFGEFDFRLLDTPTMLAAIEALKDGRLFFHTYDLATHTILRARHRMMAFEPGWRELVEAWLRRYAATYDIRGPLPGHQLWGSRWAFHVSRAGEPPKGS